LEWFLSIAALIGWLIYRRSRGRRTEARTPAERGTTRV